MKMCKPFFSKFNSLLNTNSHFIYITISKKIVKKLDGKNPSISCWVSEETNTLENKTVLRINFILMVLKFLSVLLILSVFKVIY